MATKISVAEFRRRLPDGTRVLVTYLNKKSDAVERAVFPAKPQRRTVLRSNARGLSTISDGPVYYCPLEGTELWETEAGLEVAMGIGVPPFVRFTVVHTDEV